MLIDGLSLRLAKSQVDVDIPKPETGVQIYCIRDWDIEISQKIESLETKCTVKDKSQRGRPEGPGTGSYMQQPGPGLPFGR